VRFGKRGNKFNAKKVTYDGKTFDSKKEGIHYLHLKGRLERGEIKDLRIHPRYNFTHNGVKIGSFTPDFDYFERSNVPDFWDLVVDDCKGYKSGLSYNWFRRQCKMMEAFFGVEVREI